MQQSVLQAARDLAARAGKRGTTVKPIDFDAVAAELDIEIPSWLRELFTTVPMSGLEFGWQAFEPEGDYDGMAVLEWADADGIRSESLKCYPGCAIRDLGYINVGSDSSGGGDPYFVNIHEGNDPPLYQIYHDVSDQAVFIIAKGRRVVSPKLSEFFLSAQVDA
jgi:hypothetical protein